MLQIWTLQVGLNIYIAFLSPTLSEMALSPSYTEINEKRLMWGRIHSHFVQFFSCQKIPEKNNRAVNLLPEKTDVLHNDLLLSSLYFKQPCEY